MYIVLTILMFGFLVFIHELGHFTMARIFKVPIKEFAIGMGPKIVSWNSKKYETVYSLRLLPFGGFVSMEGEGEDSESEDAYFKKPVWQRMLILVAGPTMNIIVAIVLMFGIVLTSPYLLSTTIGEFTEGAVSNAEGGLQLNDTVIKVGWVPVFSGNELVYEVTNQGTNPVDITVIRDGVKTVIKDVRFGTETDQGVSFGTPDFRLYEAQKSFGNLLKQSVSRSVSSFKMIIDSLVGLISGKYGMNAVQGPVGITNQIQDMDKQNLMDISTFFYFAAIISMNLGVFNLLPVPALDGGQLLFRFIELFRKKPIKQEIENAINTGMLLLLLAFSAFIMIKDVIDIFVK